MQVPKGVGMQAGRQVPRVVDMHMRRRTSHAGRQAGAASPSAYAACRHAAVAASTPVHAPVPACVPARRWPCMCRHACRQGSRRVGRHTRAPGACTCTPRRTLHASTQTSAAPRRAARRRRPPAPASASASRPPPTRCCIRLPARLPYLRASVGALMPAAAPRPAVLWPLPSVSLLLFRPLLLLFLPLLLLLVYGGAVTAASAGAMRTCRAACTPPPHPAR